MSDIMWFLIEMAVISCCIYWWLIARIACKGRDEARRLAEVLRDELAEYVSSDEYGPDEKEWAEAGLYNEYKFPWEVRR